MIDVDLYDTSASTIKAYKKQGKKVVCYFSAGSYETNRPDIKSFSKACYCSQKDSCKMDGWEEWWLNLHTASCKSNIQKIMRGRMALAKSKGCDAVEFDNVDSYTNENGHGNTEADQLEYNLWLAKVAHTHGLSAGLKNAGDLVSKFTNQLVSAFDFVIVEQCEQYNECDVYEPFVKKNKLAIDIEYYQFEKKPVYKKGWFTMVYKTLDLQYKNVYAVSPAYK